MTVRLRYKENDFLQSLNTPGGHILVCLFLIVFATIGAHFKIPKCEDLFLLAIGTLGRSMLDSDHKTYTVVKPDKVV